jgi:hypothetical protein
LEPSQTPNPHAERRIAVTERAVTEQQVIDVLNKHGNANNLAYFEPVYKELFPELPKAGELILVSDNVINCSSTLWQRFKEFDSKGWAVVNNGGHLEEDIIWKNYRRQTPAERGEG